MSNKLDDDIKFALDLIAAEEQDIQNTFSNKNNKINKSDNIKNQSNKPLVFNESTDEEKSGLILIEQRNFTIKNSFTLQGKDANGKSISMPISGEGVLDTFVVKSDNNSFKVRIEIDEFNVIDDDFSTLQNLTTELSHIGAYTSNGNNIVSASNYPFDERINIIITPLPGAEITLSVARAELMMGGIFNIEDGLDPETARLLEQL